MRGEGGIFHVTWMTELLQLSLSPDCLYTMEIGGAQRLLVRLVPKGTDKPAEYMVGSETRRNLERVGFMLKEQYEALGSQTLPHVPFNPATHREHDFPDPRPYLFQYQGQHLSHCYVMSSRLTSTRLNRSRLISSQRSCTRKMCA